MLVTIFKLIILLLKKDHKILAIYIKTQMTLATIYWENGFLIETLNIYDKLNEYFRKLLISLHNKGLQCRKKNLLTRFKKKLQGYIRKMSLNFIYQSIIYETIDKYEKSLECLKLFLKIQRK